ncbi:MULTISPECIES: O-antigen ligase family protein [Ramlibacter]|uniref:O-antigen ligase C-terminal domain-containing protein n=1 Tax=Ramlibacter aquaticus TaxID=2780094 RepID=A0ABR9SAQ3_9BURK|nr:MULTISPECIES: O-antigen ligase family protein [Ramlibacter]MBE7939426.1 O-antigen ligase C-terminal domain-containing protein [Ramlibacter aquaticus]
MGAAVNTTVLASPRWAALGLCLLLPWLTPYAGGPSSWVQPWLLGAACTALALALSPAGRVAPLLALVLAGVPAWAFLRSGLAPETLGLAAGCAIIAASACVAAAGAQDARFLRVLAGAWLAASLLSTLIALGQYFGFTQGRIGWVSNAALGEAYANLRQRNQFATLTSIGMATLLWFAPRSRHRLLPWLAGAVLAAGSAATTSRTGLLQLLAIGALAVAWPGPRRERGLQWSVMVLAYAAAAIALPLLLAAVGGSGTALWERVASVNSCSSRRVLYSNVVHLIAQRPWLGWGWGELDYAHFMTLYPGPRFCDILDNAHDLPLHLAVELGLPLALAVCAAIAWGLWRGRPLAEADTARQMAWGVLLAIGLHSLVEYPLWYAPFQIAAGAALGLLCARPGGQAGGTERPLSPAAAVRVALGLAALAAAGFAAWDYQRVSQVYLAPEERQPQWREDPMAAARVSWLFGPQARFADLTTTELTRANAATQRTMALDALHYSPEPRVALKAIEADVMLGRNEEALQLLQRLKAAFPKDYEDWREENHKPLRGASAGD